MQKLIVIKNDETAQLDKFSNTNYEVKRFEIQRCGNDMYAYVVLEYDDF